MIIFRLSSLPLILLTAASHLVQGAGVPLRNREVTLLNQQARPVRLASKMLGNGVAAVNLVSTICSSISPPSGSNSPGFKRCSRSGVTIGC